MNQAILYGIDLLSDLTHKKNYSPKYKHDHMLIVEKGEDYLMLYSHLESE